MRHIPNGDAAVAGAAGDLDKPPATEAAVAELKVMSADRYLEPARDGTRIKGISATNPLRCCGTRLLSPPALMRLRRLRGDRGSCPPLSSRTHR